jgi:hypothetical protein
MKKFVESFNYTFLERIDKYNMMIMCPNNHKVKMGFYNFRKGSRCKFCCWEKYSATKSTPYEKMKSFVESRGDILIYSNYKNSRSEIKVKSACGHEWNTKFGIYKGGAVCPCKRRRGFETVKEKSFGYLYPELASEWNYLKNKKITPFDVRLKSNKKFWFICQKCNYEYHICVNAKIKKGNKCDHCNSLLLKFPEIAKEWDYKKNEKTPADYAFSSNKRVWWICGVCNHNWATQIGARTRKYFTGCPQCASSWGEKRIYNYLKNKKINFDVEFYFPDLLSDLNEPLRYDFIIFTNNNRILIEYDGIQHFQYVKYFHKNRGGFLRLQKHDGMKTNYANKNFIPLLRIKYIDFDIIEDVLSKELSKYNL